MVKFALSVIVEVLTHFPLILCTREWQEVCLSLLENISESQMWIANLLLFGLFGVLLNLSGVGFQAQPDMFSALLITVLAISAVSRRL
jgi:hypothetical protein